MMAVLNGLVFQLPVILTWLIRLKVISRRFLAAKRKYVYAVLIIITMFMPPQDLLSDLIIFLPLAFLFETTMLVNLRQQ